MTTTPQPERSEKGPLWLFQIKEGEKEKEKAQFERRLKQNTHN